MAIEPINVEPGIAEKPVEELSLIVESAKNGSEEAFEQLVHLYAGEVRLFVMRHLGAIAVVDDISQEVFVQVHRSLPNYQGKGSIRAWILGIARHRILSHLRKKARRKQGQNSTLTLEIVEKRLACFDDDPFEIDAIEKDLDALRRCIAELGETQKALVNDFYFQNRSAESIGESTDTTPGALRMKLLRIRKSLAKCIRQKRSIGRVDHGQ